MVNQYIANTLWEAVGSDFSSTRYYNDDETMCVDIFKGSNRPSEGLVTYGTIDVSSHTLHKNLNDRPLRTEFIGTCEARYTLFANIISSCAFNVMSGEYSCQLGAVYKDVISQYDSTLTMDHIIFLEPFLFEDLMLIRHEGHYIAWLMPVPISSAELNYLKLHGLEALEELFENQEINVFDLNRRSVV